MEEKGAHCVVCARACVRACVRVCGCVSLIELCAIIFRSSTVGAVVRCTPASEGVEYVLAGGHMDDIRCVATLNESTIVSTCIIVQRVTLKRSS